VETLVEASILRDVKVSGSYTYLDAEVTKSFSSSSLTPVTNPAFPTIPMASMPPSLVRGHFVARRIPER